MTSLVQTSRDLALVGGVAVHLRSCRVLSSDDRILCRVVVAISGDRNSSIRPTIQFAATFCGQLLPTFVIASMTPPLRLLEEVYIG
jgi:hypothetical protein